MATYKKIISDLKAKQIAPVYFLFGDEPYYIDKVIDYITNNVLSESEKDFNLNVFYGKDTDVINNLKSGLNKYPMMASHQVVVLKEAQEIKNFDELLSYIKNPVSTTLLAISYKHKKPDKRTKFYNTLKDNAVLFESKKIREEKVPEWISSFMEDKGLMITDKASILLTEYLGSDLKKISNELEKLILDQEVKTKVDINDIERNVGISKDYNVFELQKALGFKDVVKTTKIVNYFRSNPKSNPLLMVNSILYSYFSKLYALFNSRSDKEQAAKQLGIPYFVVREHIAASNKYNNKLNQVIEILQEYDLRSKGIKDAGTDDNELMREMIYRILYI